MGQLGQWDKMKKEVKYQCVKILKLSQTSFFFWDNFLFFGTKIFLTVFRLIFEVIFFGTKCLFFWDFWDKTPHFWDKMPLFWDNFWLLFDLLFLYLYVFTNYLFYHFSFCPNWPNKKGYICE